MKKTLIALAAVAVTTGAMAQAVLSGNLAVGFAGDTAAGVETSGYGIDTANFKLSSSEDLGGGLKISGSMAFEGAVEDQNTNGNGVTLGLSGGFGSVVFSAAESSDFLPVDGLTKIAMGTDADRITYTAPTMSGFTFQVTTQDNVDIAAALGAEMDGDTSGTSSVLVLAANYTTGPISIDVQHQDFKGVYGAAGVSRVGVRGSYDFGMAKVTYGMMDESRTAANSDVKATGLTISAPVGPLSVAITSASQKTGTATKLKGSSLSVSYALSKRTGIAFYNESYDVVSSTQTKEHSLVLTHSF